MSTLYSVPCTAPPSFCARVALLATHTHPEESLTHYFIHDGKLIMRWASIVLAGATIVTMFTFAIVAIIPAILFGVALLGLYLTTILEQRTAHKPDDTIVDAGEASQAGTVAKADGGALSEEDDDGDESDVPMRIIKRETMIVVEVLIGVGALAFVLAGLLFGWEVLGIAALVLVAYMLFVTAPILLGWLEDDVEEERHAWLSKSPARV